MRSRNIVNFVFIVVSSVVLAASVGLALDLLSGSSLLIPTFLSVIGDEISDDVGPTPNHVPATTRKEYDNIQYRCNHTGIDTSGTNIKYAITSLLVDGGPYVRGAIALGRSLSKQHYNNNNNKNEVMMILMILETTVLSSGERFLLDRAGWNLCIVPLIEPKDVSAVFERFRKAFTKFGLFSWTEFERIVYLDADTLVFGDISEMFDSSTSQYIPRKDVGADGTGLISDFMACHDYESGHTIEEFNSGVFSLKPNSDRFVDFLHQIKTRSDYRLDTADQGLLRDIYSKLGYTVLPLSYNGPLGMYMFEREKWKEEEEKNKGFRVIHYTEVKPFNLEPNAREWEWEPMKLWTAASTSTAIVIMSTGKYGKLMLKKQVEALGSFWNTSETVDIFIWTDNKQFIEEEGSSNGSVAAAFSHAQQGWPKDTSSRPSVFLTQKNLFKLYTYIYTIDADLLPKKEITKDVLGDLVGMKHPMQSFLSPDKWDFERRPESQAYIPVGEGQTYYQGCFYGGKSERVIQLWEEVSRAVDKDEANGISAKWDEESHLNKFFLNNPPTLSVDASYGDPTQGSKFRGIIEHLDKSNYGGHASFHKQAN